MLPDERAIFSIREPGASDDTCNFWLARTDRGTLRPPEKMARLTNWTGFCMDPTRATRDASQFAFTKWATHRTVYIAELDARRSRILKARHLIFDERGNSPMDRAPDSKSLILFSTRNRQDAAYRQSADAKWILWQVGPMPELTGGPPELISSLPHGTLISCAR